MSSGGVIFREALAQVRALDLVEDSERDVLIALERGRPALPTLYALAQAPGFSREQTLRRAAAGYFAHCTGNLADDIADGDAAYFTEAPRVASIVQFILHNLLMAGGVDAEIAPLQLREIALRLVRAASLGSVEVRQRGWDASSYRRVGEAIAGEQWSALLLLLWAGSALERDAPRLGRQLGVAAHVIADRLTGDRRFFAMPEADRAEVHAWATAATSALTTSPYPALQTIGEMMQRQLGPAPEEPTP